MQRLKFSIVSIAALTGLVAACGPSARNDESEVKLINGTQATASEFGSALVYLMPDGKRCSGVKVGKRHILTAAHCVSETYGMTKEVLTKPQAKLEISNFPKRDSSDTSLWHSGYILSIATPDPFFNFLAECYTAAATPEAQEACSGDWKSPEDLAVITFKRDLPEQWPTAKLDLTPVKAGDTVQFLGYGCEKKVSVRSNIVRKKYGEAKVLSWNQVSQDMQYGVQAIKGQDIEKTGFLTQGPEYPGMAAKKLAGLCPVDSGGPVFRKGTSQVVGVNKWIQIGPGDTPFFQTHSRLASSDPGKAEIEQFLRSNLPASAFVQP